MSNKKATEIIEEIEDWNPERMDDEIYKLLKQEDYVEEDFEIEEFVFEEE